MSKLTREQEELIERFGVIQEQSGFAPASARVNALLTVSDKTSLTFDEIRETLQLSKSATSNAINNLLVLGRIGYKTQLGERKRYFYSKLDHWRTMFRKDILGRNDHVRVLEDILKARTKDTKSYNHELQDLVKFMEYFITESISLIDSWEPKEK